MTRTLVSMDVADLSAFAKSVREQFSKFEGKPSHVDVLNLLSRAAGFRNYQHLRASGEKPVTPVSEERETQAETSLADATRVMRTLRVFDGDGRIVRWPTKRSQQELCLWYLWSKVPGDSLFAEREIGSFLDGLHTFGDAALLRRDMVDLGLMRRNRDGSDYRRLEKRPPPELSLLLQRLGAAQAQ